MSPMYESTPMFFVACILIDLYYLADCITTMIGRCDAPFIFLFAPQHFQILFQNISLLISGVEMVAPLRGANTMRKIRSTEMLLLRSKAISCITQNPLPTSDFRLPTSDFRLPTSDF